MKIISGGITINMGHLMKLELKKVHFRNYILLSLLLIILSMYFVFVALHDSSETARTFENTLRVVEMIFAFVFIIFFAVLNSALVISEYNNRTILLMFTYPVSKKKVIFAKLLVITLFIVMSIVVGYIFNGLFIVGLDGRFDLLEGEFGADVLGRWILRAAVTVIVFSCLGLWTFAAGMVRKSVAVTIVSSVLFIFLRQIVITAGGSGQEGMGVVLITVGITAAAMWYVFTKKITELE